MLALPQPVSLGHRVRSGRGRDGPASGRPWRGRSSGFRALHAYRFDILAASPGSRRSPCCRSSTSRPPPGASSPARPAHAARPPGPPLVAAASPWPCVGRAVLLESFSPRQKWSPYNKLTDPSAPRDPRPERVREQHSLPGRPFAGGVHPQKPFYLYPYRHVTPPRLGNVLIIGAGTGNDAAVALSEGAQHVDAGGDRPVAGRLGGRHPNHPYTSPG